MENIDWNEVAEDPNCDQLIRDLARTKLAENEDLKKAGRHELSLDNVWLESIERNERFGSNLSDASLVKIASNVLLHDEDSDGCSVVIAVTRPDGTRSAIDAYPKLVSACRSVIDDKSSKNELKADAHVVLGELYHLQKTPLIDSYREEETHFRKALLHRPEDWRIYAALSVMYMRHDQIALSLQCISQAMDLVSNKKAKFDLLTRKGKLLSNLCRTDDAISCLEQAMIEYEDVKEDFSPKDRGHAALAQYALCQNYFSLSNRSKHHRKKLLHHWKQAELKRSELPNDVLNRLDWGFRDLAQMIVAKIKPDAALSHRECHYCHKVTDDVKKCSACKVVVYCSKKCQAAAWKSGHKQECSKAKSTRKEEKKAFKKKENIQKLILDDCLLPDNLWKKGLQTLENDPVETVWNFLVAIYMDWSLFKSANTSMIKRAVDLVRKKLKASSDPRGKGMYEAMVLSMLTHYGNMNPSECSGKILEIMSNSAPTVLVPEKKVPTKLAEVNRNRFAFGAAFIFHARLIMKCNPLHVVGPRQSREAWQKAALVISEARLFIDREQWLTFQFELGYVNFDMLAVDEGKKWLTSYVDNLEKVRKRMGGTLPDFWQEFKDKAEQRLKMVPMVENQMKMFGPTGTPFVF